MEDLKVVFAGNLINLRTRAGMTQAELAEKINYSDKSVSKWERAEALPDVSVVKAMAELFGVTVDYMLCSHEGWEKPEEVKTNEKRRSGERRFSPGVVILVAILGIWTVALFVFVVFWMLGHVLPIIFLAAVPATLITLLVLNSVWSEDRRYNMIIVQGLILSIFLLVYFIFFKQNPWQLLLVLIPAELVVYFSFRIKKGFLISEYMKKRKKTQE